MSKQGNGGQYGTGSDEIGCLIFICLILWFVLDRVVALTIFR